MKSEVIGYQHQLVRSQLSKNANYAFQPQAPHIYESPRALAGAEFLAIQ
jgi:hypothetical protein